ncbi:MAG: DNA-binding protein [Candidatus Schekmanbacteria bacterium RBG_13_48_7]|uniref:DNA-binding protein n=1 Tax=Candidatus Schekmanbacteria bacterium RBG_13_48_7 TaxID=1817878 RepID=A0A1F7S2D9_9BACT|nr:MAG: DNA-binding protein [Candidatus Schekmanbacteria bacterium RBG_13_48_7]
MRGVLIDSNILLDLFTNDPTWADWSETKLEEYSQTGSLYINPIIYSEVSVGFTRIEDLESALIKGGFIHLDIPREALFLAGKTFLAYRKRKGDKRSPLPDFYIGAQAVVLGIELITRDVRQYREYFPTVRLICP